MASVSLYKNFLDIGFFDDLDENDFDDDFDIAVNVVASDESRFQCSDCKNTYKTASGLERHFKKKHSASVTDVFIRCGISEKNEI